MIKSSNSKAKILVAPLNWGLGHVSRCIPIIRTLQTAGMDVVIACGREQKRLLESEFSDLRFVDLPGYDVKYGKSRSLTLLKIIFQIPKILIRIKRENRWLKQFLASEKVDAVISDNRYGLFSEDIRCVFMTHQLAVKTPFGRKMERLIQHINYRYISKFSECWVPDFENEPSLAGELSHPDKLTVNNIRYIGCLSRFKKLNTGVKGDHLLVILSGPEPQRTIFENMVARQLPLYRGPVIVLRGIPDKKEMPFMGANITVHNHLPSAELNKLICESAYIICRSGYSSVMDIVKLGKKSIVIPTPGQTEQEYLARFLSGQKIVCSTDQEKFVLSDAINKAKKFSYRMVEGIDDSLSEKAVQDLVRSIVK